MAGKFVIAKDTPPEVLDWGKLRWMSNPPTTGAGQLTVIDVTLAPGKGHNFHKHPDQEEVIYVVGGQVEQWMDREKRMLSPGDCAFIPADVVHASFNVGTTTRIRDRAPSSRELCCIASSPGDSLSLSLATNARLSTRLTWPDHVLEARKSAAAHCARSLGKISGQLTCARELARDRHTQRVKRA